MKTLRMAVLFSVAMLMSGLTVGCGKGAGDSGEFTTGNSSKSRKLVPDTTRSSESAVVTAVSALGSDLISEQSGNTVVAPFSAAQMLAALRAGAVGQTRTGLNAVMHLSDDVAGVDAAFNSLDLAISNRTAGYSFSAAGWSQTRYGYRLSYLDNLAENYGLTTQSLDFAFATTTAMEAVNRWARQADAPLLPTLSQDTRLVLAGALQLNTAWEDPFDPALVQTGPFQLLIGEEVQVPFLRRSGQIRQAQGDGYLAFELPLTGGQQFLAVLPDQLLDDFEASLTAQRWQQIDASLVPVQTDLAIPSFSITRSLELNLRSASSRGGADFSEIDGSRELFVSLATHITTISVGATGLSADSFTFFALEGAPPQNTTGSNGYYDFVLTAQHPFPVATVTLSRPFLFAVRDKATGALLFLGRVVDPRPQ